MLHFAVVTDIHYGFDAGNKKGSKAPALIDRFVRVANRNRVDFSIDLGDRVIRRDADRDAVCNDSLTRQFNALAAPHYSADGNHDINLPRTPSRVERIEGYSLIVWNPELKNGPEGFDIEPEDMQWLDDALAAAEAPAIFAFHIPVDNNDKDNKQALSRDKKPFYSFVKQAAEIRRKLEDSGKVFLCLSGHRHRNRRHEINGIWHVTFQSLVQIQKSSGHAIGAFYDIKIDDDKIRIKGYGRGQKTRELPRFLP